MLAFCMLSSVPAVHTDRDIMMDDVVIDTVRDEAAASIALCNAVLRHPNYIHGKWSQSKFVSLMSNVFLAYSHVMGSDEMEVINPVFTAPEFASTLLALVHRTNHGDIMDEDGCDYINMTTRLPQELQKQYFLIKLGMRYNDQLCGVIARTYDRVCEAIIEALTTLASLPYILTEEQMNQTANFATATVQTLETVDQLQSNAEGRAALVSNARHAAKQIMPLWCPIVNAPGAPLMMHIAPKALWLVPRLAVAAGMPLSEKQLVTLQSCLIARLKEHADWPEHNLVSVTLWHLRIMLFLFISPTSSSHCISAPE